MTPPKKPSNEDELRRIEDLLVQSILAASPADLRAELAEAGDDPDARIADVDMLISEVKAECAKKRLEKARAEAAAFRAARGSKPVDLDAAKARLQRLKNPGVDQASPMMLAARKGVDLTEGDEDAVLKALADLERLEREQDQQ